MDPITVVGLAASVAQLADLAGRVFMGLFGYYRQVKEAPTRSRELRDELQAVADLLDSLKSLFIQLTAVKEVGLKEVGLLRLEESVAHFETFLVDLENRTMQARTQGIYRLKWPFSKDENRRLIETIGRYKETFILALTMQQT
jgi:hypothetical protein